MPEMRLPLLVRVEESDHMSRNCLLEDGWREVEVLQVWVRELPDAIDVEWNDYVIEMAGTQFRQQCAWIAGTAFTEDRLHKDPEVPDQLASRQKMRFTEESFDESERSIYIARQGKNVHGFVIVTADREYCTINLIAVDRRHRKKGIAKRLLAYLAAAYKQPIVAGTQATNDSSLALYKSAGFTKHLSYRSFHK